MSTYNQKSRWKDGTKESVIDSINALTARMCKLKKSNIQTTICFLIVLKNKAKMEYQIKAHRLDVAYDNAAWLTPERIQHINLNLEAPIMNEV